MKIQSKKPPANAKRIYAWNDLPTAERKETFTVHDPGHEPREVTVGGKRARVLKGLMRGPLYAASYARIGDHVCHLKHDHGVDIETLMFRNDPETGRDVFGVYELRSAVTLGDGEAD